VPPLTFLTSLFNLLGIAMKSLISLCPALQRSAPSHSHRPSRKLPTARSASPARYPTCSIDAQASGAVNKAVTLPTVSKRTLGANGATAGTSAATDLTFALTGCTAGTKALAHFENGPTVDQTTGYLTNQSTNSPATNVEVRLLNASLQPINIVTSANNDFTTDGVAITSGSGNMKYFAQYFATGAATAGEVKTSVQYTMQYQ
jgi:major type 1 subunit fimbrin (pilin)